MRAETALLDMVPAGSDPAGKPPAPRVSALELGLLLLFLVVAIARIAATYRIYSQTFDEPAHVGAGIELLSTGRFTLNRMHPPLPRVLIAALPYAAGVRYSGDPNLWGAGADALREHGDYQRMLTLARIGVLPYLVLAVLATWWLGRRLFGVGAGLVAAGSLSLLPPILAHAGLATTDMPVTGVMPLVAIAALPWLDDPTRRASLRLGAAIGLAFLTKFSALVFVPAILVLLLATKLVVEPGTSDEKLRRWRRLEWPTALVALVTAVVVWAGYRFSIGSLADTALGPLVSPRLAHLRVIPAPEFWQGILELLGYNMHGMPTFLMGEARRGSWWYFFPLAIAVKTPLAFLVASVAGLAWLLRRAWATRTWRTAAPVVIALAILAVVMRSNLNFGLRYVLPIYPFLAVAAGAAAVALWERARPLAAGRGAATLLGAWLLVASARAHPEYLPDFNEVAGGHPERFLAESDLDWGQDIGRLQDTLRARGIDTVAVALHGITDPRQFDPRLTVRRFVPDSSTGWVAMSSWWRFGQGYGRYLRDDELVARIGRSIWLYYVPPRDSAAGSAGPG